MRTFSLIFLSSLIACEDKSLYCNDDPEQKLLAVDGDCDGVETWEDCDDSDPDSLVMAEDGDCDGVLTADDCDDDDADSTVVADDADCDGVLTADDCDDSDAASTVVSEDADCDGVLATDDCDDEDETLLAVATDLDCDGALDAEECDAGAAIDTEIDGDCDDDGVLAVDDCDDEDADSTVVAEDGDCDGVLTADDCDDTDASSTVVSEDADCDGVLTADDCNDADATNLLTFDDPDCDFAPPGYAYITQSYSGSGIVNNGTYTGTASLSWGVNPQAGTGVLDSLLVWSTVGTPATNPTVCTNCVFTFDISATFLPNQSIDPNGYGIDMNFSYALGVNAYGANTLWYGSYNSWSEWLVDGTEQTDLAGTIFTRTVTFDGTNFSYDQGLVDFYYYY